MFAFLFVSPLVHPCAPSLFLCQARVERVEKEVEVAKREGRPEVKHELEALLPALKDAKRKATAQAKALLKQRAASSERSPNKGQRRRTIMAQSSTREPPSPYSPGTPFSPSMTQSSSSPMEATQGEQADGAASYPIFEQADGVASVGSADTQSFVMSGVGSVESRPADNRAFEVPKAAAPPLPRLLFCLDLNASSLYLILFIPW